MKIKFLMAGLLGLISATTFAQKGELNNAQSSYESYEALRSQPKLSDPKLADAKTSIDKAAANEKTANLPQTYALKGAIYSALAVKDTVPTTSAPLFAAADEALKKAKELDTKGEYKKIIDNAYLNLAQYNLNFGVKYYQSGKFDMAYKSFNYYRTVLPEDTNAIYYTGLSAANAASNDSKYYPLAIENYNKLVTTKYSKSAGIYVDISSLDLANHDTTAAIKAVNEGLTKYPNNQALAKRQIELGLQTGRTDDVIAKLDAAIANDPKNKTLYYYAGLTYSQIAEGIAAKQGKTKDAAAKAALQSKKLENYTKAAEMYKKALEIDPDYFEANLNMGYVLINPAIDAYNAANQLPASKQKEYEAAIAKANAQFDSAKPYLVKAVELKPNSVDALVNLNTYYRAKKDKVNADATQKKIDELKK
jgi:thioredoxin-like negative regulator of GroEL